MERKYIMGDICVTSHVHDVMQGTVIRFPAEIRSEMEAYLQRQDLQGLLYEQRNGLFVYIPYDLKEPFLKGEKESSIVFTEEQDCQSRRVIAKPPRSLGVIGNSSQVAPYLLELIAYEYKLHRQQGSNDDSPPESYRKQWLQDHPEFRTTQVIPNLTTHLSDTNLMFIILAFALLMIIFLAGHSRNWLQYHD